MSSLHVLSRAGDHQVVWDPAAVAACDPEAVAAIQEAEHLFADLRARGGTAFALGPGQRTTRLDHFDPSFNEIVLVPRIIGG
jgi:hypothetical protein